MTDASDSIKTSVLDSSDAILMQSLLFQMSAEAAANADIIIQTVFTYFLSEPRMVSILEGIASIRKSCTAR